jgi:predicted Rossmann-fold nucleotide-binding protein
MFELLTLAQTEKLSEKIDVVLYGSEYWNQILNFKPMVEWGAIAPGDLDALHPADTPQEAFERLRDHLTRHHLEPQRPKSPGLAVTRG